MRRHKWNYGSGADRYTAKYRVCEHCPMHQRTFGVGAGRHWDWRLGSEETWNTGRAPECPEPPAPQTEWSRVEDKHPRWEIKNPKGDGKNYLCTDAVIRAYGRRHTEKLLHDLPPLPDKAWEVDPRRCTDYRTCVNSCASGPCSRQCQVCTRLAGSRSVPCPACPDAPGDRRG